MEDKRSKKIIVVSHCIINQNSKVYGLASYPAVNISLVKFFIDNDLGILQMPCPETTYLGIGRWQYVKQQYDTPAFRNHCKKIIDSVLDQIEDYQKHGYRIIAILGIDGSPSCGVNLTPKHPNWGGMIPPKLPSSTREKEKGVFMEILDEELKKRGLKIPLIGVPETPEIGSIENTIVELKKIV
jgi:predicted secreted protein